MSQGNYGVTQDFDFLKALSKKMIVEEMYWLGGFKLTMMTKCEMLSILFRKKTTKRGEEGSKIADFETT